MKRSLSIILLAVGLGACATTPQKFTAAPDTVTDLKKVHAADITIGTISAPADFSRFCRGDNMISPAGTRMSFEGYIQDALIESLKEAGKYTDSNPKITLSGTVDNLYFSTTDGGLSDGHWDIQLRVNSSNGKFLVVSEHYKFKASYFGITACNNASKAFFPAVQEMISKLVSSKEFGTLVATKAPQHHHKRNRG